MTILKKQKLCRIYTVRMRFKLTKESKRSNHNKSNFWTKYKIHLRFLQPNCTVAWRRDLLIILQAVVWMQSGISQPKRAKLKVLTLRPLLIKAVTITWIKKPPRNQILGLIALMRRIKTALTKEQSTNPTKMCKDKVEMCHRRKYSIKTLTFNWFRNLCSGCSRI